MDVHRLKVDIAANPTPQSIRQQFLQQSDDMLQQPGAESFVAFAGQLEQRSPFVQDGEVLQNSGVTRDSSMGCSVNSNPQSPTLKTVF